MTGEAEFDRYKTTYTAKVQSAIGFTGQNIDFYTRAKVNHLRALIERHVGDPSRCRVLDVGCGVGLTDEFLADSLGHLEGVDVAEALVEAARERNPGVTYQAYDGRTLPHPDDSFDVVFAICVVHHVPPAMWQEFLTELGRVTRAEGFVAIFEHNPFNPLTRKAVKDCEFDQDAVLVGNRALRRQFTASGLDVVEAAHIIVAPFDSKITAAVERALAPVPVGAQHYVAGRPRKR